MKVKIFILTLIISVSAAAGPARKGLVLLNQPDGSVIEALLQGDEFTRIKTTAEGNAIMQDEDGWWCYAVFDADGCRYSSGYRVGTDAPAAILHESRNIPYAALAEIASRKREQLKSTWQTPVLKKICPPAETKAGPVTKHGLVILAQYKDVQFKNSKEDFENLLLEKGYSAHGASGSAKEYFDAQFEGKVNFDFHVSNIITLPRNRSYYGSNDADGQDKNPAEMITDACKEVDGHIDFSLFDDDNDGCVDNVFVFFAGADEAEGADEECIWSHAWYVLSGAGINLTLDGKVIDRYACTSEMTRMYSGNRIVERISGIGTFCHEYSHTFGLPDFYDTDYEKTGGWAAGLWCCTSLMDSGNQNNGGNTPPYFNAIERMLLGLDEPLILDTPGTYTMSPISNGGRFYRLDTDTEGEYYLFECRNETGWDAYIGGSGMLAYHIDMSKDVLRKWSFSNDLNCDITHQCADLIEADSRLDIFADIEDLQERTNNIRGIFFPYKDVTSLTAESNPGLRFWNGKVSTWGINAIKKEGNDIKFNLIDSSADSEPPVAANIRHTSFTDAAIINFESSYTHEGEATVRWSRTGKEAETLTVEPYSPGKYCVILEDLEPGGKTYSVEILFIRNEFEGEATKISFMTKRQPSVEWPYIYMSLSEGRNDDGSFRKGTRIPLRVYNAKGAAEIRWYFNGKRISHEGDGSYTLPGNGTLKAEVLWEDGSRDLMEKQISISGGEI